ncbi:MAG: tryptophan-rich sensory protein [Ruminococcus sp.]|nr:tryptophan-rich sensory protein [Ruminococcus sp.]
MKKIRWTELIIFIVSAELTGAISALLAGSYKDFYASLIQPPFAPPSAVFPVVWGILYALMGISAYLIWKEPEDRGAYRSTALTLYAVQLAVNFVWSIIFFRFGLLTAAAVVAVILAALVGAMVYSFARVKNTAAWLNVPYLLWSIFAAYLAIGNAILN